eukprot:2916372-Rhodomonas_salina.3
MRVATLVATPLHPPQVLVIDALTLAADAPLTPRVFHRVFAFLTVFQLTVATFGRRALAPAGRRARAAIPPAANTTPVRPRAVPVCRLTSTRKRHLPFILVIPFICTRLGVALLPLLNHTVPA